MVDYTLRHTYTRGCPRVLAMVTEPDTGQVAMQVVELTGCPDEIIASISRDPADDSGYSIILTWDNADQGTVSIRWDAEPEIPGQPAQGEMPKTFTSADDGLHTVRITDEDDPNRWIVLDFEIPYSDPDELTLTVSPAPGDPSGYTALAIWGPGDGPEPPGELDITIGAGSADGYTALATWTQGVTP